jgi:hypothetical protein
MEPAAVVHTPESVKAQERVRTMFKAMSWLDQARLLERLATSHLTHLTRMSPAIPAHAHALSLHPPAHVPAAY